MQCGPSAEDPELPLALRWNARLQIATLNPRLQHLPQKPNEIKCIQVLGGILSRVLIACISRINQRLVG